MECFTLRAYLKAPIIRQGYLTLEALLMAELGRGDVSDLIRCDDGLYHASAAFLAEIWGGCIEAVPRGQWEAAQALNLKYVARMRFVVLPQAFKIALPPTVGYVVQIIKGTSLAAIIGFTEITRAGQIINNPTFQPLHVFTTVPALYFLICWPLSLLAARMERKRARALAR